MNRLIISFFLISVFFLTCSKEEEENMLPPSFECYIDGVNFLITDITTPNTSYPLSIQAQGSLATVTLNFKLLIPEQGEVIIFSLPDYARVEINNKTYSNSYWGPPYEGEINISEKSNGLISGTFFFKATDVNSNNLIPIEVTSGSFSNIAYE